MTNHMKHILPFFFLLAAAGMTAQVTVLPPERTVSGAAYSFEQDGITVSCTKGAIYPADAQWNTSGVDYFGCHAGETITFSAETPIKGLVVNGWVKKFFEATSDHGSIAFLSPDEDDQAADPVMVVTDIDANSISITCAKQLRCYQVTVYFDTNPTDTIGGVTPPAEGEVFFFTYNTSNAVYDSAYSTPNRPYNYYLYLWNEEDEDHYVGLDIYTAEKDRFEGMYSLEDGSMTEYSFYQFGENFEDYSTAVEGAMVINLQEGSATDYTISGYITCENGNTYNFSFTGPVLLDDEQEQGIESIQPSAVSSQKVLRKGQLFILRDCKIFNAQGAEVH